MNLKDIIDLAKAGYKPADVKELIELAEKHNEPEKEEPEKEEPEKEEPEKEEPEKEEPSEVDELKAQIKALQDANTKKDNSGNAKDDNDILADFIRGFM